MKTYRVYLTFLLLTAILSEVSIAQDPAYAILPKPSADRMQSQVIKLDSIMWKFYSDLHKEELYIRKESFEYNYNGQLVNRSEFTAEKAGAPYNWLIQNEIQNTYDDSGRILETKIAKKIDGSDTLVVSDREHYFYPDKDNAVKDYYRTINNPYDLMKIATVYQSFENGKLKEEIQHVYNPSKQKMELQTKIRYNYLSTGELKEINTYFYDSKDEMWNHYQSEVYEYDADNHLVEINLKYLTDNQIPTWYVHNRKSYTYANGVMSSYIFSYHDKETDELVESSKEEFKYDLSVSPDDIIFNKFVTDKYPLKNKVTLSQYYKMGSGAWSESIVSEYHYSDLSATSVVETAANATLLYPNPTSGVVYFTAGEDLIGSTIEIYDLAGRKLITQTLSGNASLSLGNLDAGMYIYKLTAAGIVKTGKIVKE